MLSGRLNGLGMNCTCQPFCCVLDLQGSLGASLVLMMARSPPPPQHPSTILFYRLTSDDQYPFPRPRSSKWIPPSCGTVQHVRADQQGLGRRKNHSGSGKYSKAATRTGGETDGNHEDHKTAFELSSLASVLPIQRLSQDGVKFVNLTLSSTCKPVWNPG